MPGQAQALAVHDQAALLEGRVQNFLDQALRQAFAPTAQQGVARKGGLERVLAVQLLGPRQAGGQEVRESRPTDPLAALLVPTEGFAFGGKQIQAGFQGGGVQAGQDLEPGLVGAVPAAQQQNGAGRSRAVLGLGGFAVAGALMQIGQLLQQAQLVGQFRVFAAQFRRQGTDQNAPGHSAQG